jgi:hypothetical protein
MNPIFVTAAIAAGYAFSLWALLRRERPVVLLNVLSVCLVSLVLRIAHTGDFPAGLNEDEVKTLWQAVREFRNQEFFALGPEGPLLLSVLFQAPLVGMVSTLSWAIRLYPLLTGVLSSAAAFAAARAMQLRVAASLAVAVMVAVLPWSIFYGRVSFGGELTFHQLLLLAALARLVWAQGRWAEVAIAALGLGLLLYDYTAGWSMLGMPVVAAVLARGWRRFMCVAVLLLAVAAWLPYLTGPSMQAHWGQVINKVPEEMSTGPFEALTEKSVKNFQVFQSPTARNGWMTIRSAGIHPPIVLALGLIGLLTGTRRTLFLGLGFLGGLAPSVLSEGVHPSAHRMLMAFPFVSLAAGCALSWNVWPWLRRAVTVAVCLGAAVQGIGMYFSPSFWPAESRWMFDWERTRVTEAVSAERRRLVLSQDLGIFFSPYGSSESGYEKLTLENWFPAEAGNQTYAFGPQWQPLQPFYTELVGPERVETFGRAFSVEFGHGDWLWVRKYGWVYEARCGDQQARRTTVPVLYQVLAFPRLWCAQETKHVWRGRWNAGPADLRLRFRGRASVRTSAGTVAEGEVPGAGSLDFHVQPGDEIVATVQVPLVNPSVFVVQLTPSHERIPPWNSVSPLGVWEAEAILP